MTKNEKGKAGQPDQKRTRPSREVPLVKVTRVALLPVQGNLERGKPFPSTLRLSLEPHTRKSPAGDASRS